MIRYLFGILRVFALSLMLSVGCGGEAFPCTEQGVRDAITHGGGPHTFACDGTTTVVTEDTIDIYRGATILDGEGNLTIDGNNNHLVFRIPYEDVTLELRGITITKGADVCGAIWNWGTLTLTNSTVSGNSGRAICNEGTLTLTNSAVSDNSCTTYAFGSGISNGAPGTATLTHSTVSGNTCANGAGISNLGAMTLTKSIVSGNGAEGSGGGINNEGAMTLINSTVSSNGAGSAGGGIQTSRGKLTLTHSTVSGNSASSEGGGIRNWGTTTLINSTVSGNSAAYGGGIWNYDGELILTNTLVDNECYWLEDVVTSGGYNIESPGNTCGFDTNEGDQVYVSADNLNLGPLQDNGGPTMTHALGPGSVAIDWIPEEDCVDADGMPLTTDQRGLPRPVGNRCDVGAYEVQP